MIMIKRIWSVARRDLIAAAVLAAVIGALIWSREIALAVLALLALAVQLRVVWKRYHAEDKATGRTGFAPIGPGLASRSESTDGSQSPARPDLRLEVTALFALLLVFAGHNAYNLFASVSR